MFNKILVCLDGSTLAEQIIPYATEQALHFHSEVVLFQAINVPTTMIADASAMAPGGAVPVTPTPEEIQELENEAETYLENQAEQMRRKDLQVSCVSQLGVPAEAIISYAAEDNISLIAMATNGRSGLSRTVLGSVADEVIRKSNLPILVMRPSEETSK